MTTRAWIVLTAVAAAAATVAAPAADDKTAVLGKKVELFNGKDLTGWKTHPDDKAKWEVVDGTIVGTGEKGHLFSERGDYENFVYTVVAKISDKGNSGQYFRTQFAKAFPPGYEAQINATGGDPVKTGSLYKFAPLVRNTAPHAPDEFFTQEVKAVGNHIVIKVNGKVTVDFTDKDNTYTKGHFAIQQHDPGSRVTVKSISVVELPATK